ncbi:hypothetical protein RchiOBHm_Chr5g0037871 [Rosa chinensis]|uniref:Uncharacterized protein n=1 Tax=Rosa chinensis TaxID=74649 RepID=A0A2P6QBU7_ROSCH|nr:hypothetical protein RchiOBHm_Chr5g0037871 [Rosa chinensis]
MNFWVEDIEICLELVSTGLALGLLVRFKNLQACKYYLNFC